MILSEDEPKPKARQRREEGGGGQGVVGERVDLAHEAGGGGEEGLDGGLGEQGTIEAGEAETMFEVEASGVAVETRQGVADRDALGEGFEVEVLWESRLLLVRNDREAACYELPLAGG